MKKRLAYMAWAFATALLLTGCTTDDDATLMAGQSDYITFGAQVVEPVTRAAQQPGSIDFVKLTETSFGVYGYGPTASDYSATLSPNMFDNQKVEYVISDNSTSTVLAVPGSWSYAWDAVNHQETLANLKPWPKSTDEARNLTFFAYGPYMADVSNTGPGITAVSKGGTGDPTIGYKVATTPPQSVDLLWGVQSETGLPWKNVTRANKSVSAVLFTMRHALCAVGFHAQVIVNQNNELTDLYDNSAFGTKIGTTCRVTIKSITLKPKTKSFYESGTLNLNDTVKNTPLWTVSEGDRTITQLELRGDEIDAKLWDPAPDDATDYTHMTTDAVPGITESANSQIVIAKDGSSHEQFYMLIPDDSQDYEATVEYYVTYKTGEDTYKRTLYTGKAAINNLELKAGTLYYLNLVFGLTTFKLVVTAEDWTDKAINSTILVEDGTSANSSLSRKQR